MLGDPKLNSMHEHAEAQIPPVIRRGEKEGLRLHRLEIIAFFKTPKQETNSYKVANDVGMPSVCVHAFGAEPAFDRGISRC